MDKKKHKISNDNTNFSLNGEQQIREDLMIRYISYDPKSDMYYMKLNDNVISHQEFTNAIVDVDLNGNIVGIELFGFNSLD